MGECCLQPLGVRFRTRAKYDTPCPSPPRWGELSLQSHPVRCFWTASGRRQNNACHSQRAVTTWTSSSLKTGGKSNSRSSIAKSIAFVGWRNRKQP